MKSQATNLRNAVVSEIVRRYRAERGTTISRSDARAMLRGEARSDQYAFAVRIADEYGLDR